MICDYCKEPIEGQYWEVESDNVCEDCFEEYAIEYVKGFAIKEVI